MNLNKVEVKDALKLAVNDKLTMEHETNSMKNLSVRDVSCEKSPEGI